MKATKLIAAAIFAVTALAIAGPAGAHAGHGGGHASSARSASHATHNAGMGNRADLEERNRRLSGFYPSFGYYPNYGYGYGNEVVENYDEADWGDQWTSVYEDNDGPYAKSTLENPPGMARMWEIKDKPGKDEQ
jgi:hypothetical protein